MRCSQIDGICNGCYMGRWARDSRRSMVLSICRAPVLSYDIHKSLYSQLLALRDHRDLTQNHAIKHLSCISRNVYGRCTYSQKKTSTAVLIKKNEPRRKSLVSQVLLCPLSTSIARQSLRRSHVDNSLRSILRQESKMPLCNSSTPRACPSLIAPL